MFIKSQRFQHFYNNYKQNSKKHDSKTFNLYKNKFKWIDIKFGKY